MLTTGQAHTCLTCPTPTVANSDPSVLTRTSYLARKPDPNRFSQTHAKLSHATTRHNTPTPSYERFGRSFG